MKNGAGLQAGPSYTGDMTTLTLNTDDELLAKASAVADRRHVAIEAVLTEALELFAREAGTEAACSRLREPIAEEPGGMLTRDEMNYRPSEYLAAREAEEAARGNGNAFLKAVREAGTFYLDGPLTRDRLNER